MNNNLKDRIFGCWLGKNIGGTIGAPVEGWKNPPMLPMAFPEKMEPNDDLDLQLLWLALMRKKGLRFTHEDLMYAWDGTNYPYDEYGIARANIDRGLRPPMTGSFNNFFAECMGCPIRSEIWAAVAANEPEIAAHYAMLDATVDHAGESVYAEVFYAALEAMAFSCEPTQEALLKLIQEALEYIPESSQVRQGVELTMKYYAEGRDLTTELRPELIRRYDVGNFSHCIINIAFTIAGLLYGECDFLKTMVLAANLGYDADCTASTAGAVLGILLGEQMIRDTYKLPFDERIITGGIREGVTVPKNLGELTEWTLELNELLAKEADTLPRLKKGFTIPQAIVPPCHEGQMELHRSFRIGSFSSYEEAVASNVWQTVHTPNDILDLASFVQDGKNIYVRAIVKSSSGKSVRISPCSSGAVTVWLDGRKCGEDVERDFAPSPHRSWAVGECDMMILPEKGVEVLTEVVPRKDATPLLFAILVAFKDKFHDITATITSPEPA